MSGKTKEQAFTLEGRIVNMTLPMAYLVEHPRNYNQHPDSQITQLKASHDRFSQYKSVVVWERPDHEYMIVAGHGIIEAMKKRGVSTVRADILPQDTPQHIIDGILAADNLHAQNSQPDEATLAELLQGQLDDGYDLASLGTDEETLRQMLESLGNDVLDGDAFTQEDGTPTKHATLADRFIVPPFSVLDARQGYWQERKRAWIALGIQSELGRGEAITWGDSLEVTEPGLNYYRNQNKATPGGSPRDAATLGKDGHTVRGDGHGRPIAQQQNNGLLGFSEQARSHYNGKMGGTPMPDGHGGLSDQLANKRPSSNLARCFGQDLMKGEHIVGKAGKAQSLPTAPDGMLIIDHYRGRGDNGKAKNVKGLLGSSETTIHGYDDGGPGGTVSQSGTSIFDPVLCELAYRWFSPPDGVVLDPFAGGSVRGIVAAKTGRQYIGIDLRQEQIAANEQQARRILSTHASVVLDVTDPAADNTPDVTPVLEHGGYLVKRDDLYQIAGVRGGKVRTVWALAQGAIGLVTAGSRHSPHVHRVAAIAQRLGIPCRVHIATGENTPDVQGAEDAGAEIIRHKAGYLNVLNARAREDAIAHNWTLIPFGVVCLEAVKQIKHQTSNLPNDMKRLVVAVGSGISLSGILHGLKEQGREVPILGVMVGKDPTDVLDQYAPKHWRQSVTLVQSPLKFEEHPQVTHLGDIPLDPVYEAKCLPYLQEGDVLWSIGIRASETQPVQDAPQARMPTWIVGDSRNLTTLCPDLHTDLIFTCPPYYDLEVYSEDKQDLSTVGTYEEFMAVYRDIFKQAIATLKENRFVCVVVGDIRDKKGFYRNFVSDTISACQDAGARLYNEAILVTSVGSLPIRVGKQFSSGRKLGKTHQNVLVFCKGNPQQAVKDCGPVMVEVPEDEEVIAEVEEEIVNG